ncbi:MAG: phosphoadenosine phosphosulfate reductase [Pseudomonadota bacterium]
MQDAAVSIAPKLSDLSLSDWHAAMARLGRQHGYYTELGSDHGALFVDEGETLIVTFENTQDIRNDGKQNEPLGFDLVRATGWSLLSLMASDDTWFRAQEVYDFFDSLTDDGFFDNFDRVLFYGRGMCGYAAASFSAAHPGSAVLLVQPQATLDPRITGWDTRFRAYRRLNFTDRYGYAPDMIDAAQDAYVIFDPKRPMDAAHAALFAKSHVSLIPAPHSSGDLQKDLLEMKVLYRLLARIGVGPLGASGLAKMMRARRKYGPYLRRLLIFTDASEKQHRTAKLSRAILQHMRMPIARKRLTKAMEDGIKLPEPLTGNGAEKAQAAPKVQTPQVDADPLRLRS